MDEEKEEFTRAIPVGEASINEASSLIGHVEITDEMLNDVATSRVDNSEVAD